MKAFKAFKCAAEEFGCWLLKPKFSYQLFLMMNIILLEIIECLEIIVLEIIKCFWHNLKYG